MRITEPEPEGDEGVATALLKRGGQALEELDTAQRDAQARLADYLVRGGWVVANINHARFDPSASSPVGLRFEERHRRVSRCVRAHTHHVGCRG